MASRIHALINGIVGHLVRLVESDEEQADEIQRVKDLIDTLPPLLPSYGEILNARISSLRMVAKFARKADFRRNEESD